MEQSKLGLNGPRVSSIGLGTVKFGRNRDVKYPDSFELPSDGELDAILECALDAGINFLDTAAAYGLSEDRLGRWMQQQARSPIICTKAGEDFDESGSTHDYSVSGLRSSCSRSLERLNQECLDIFLLHSDGRDEELMGDAAIHQLFGELKAEGKITSAGISAKTPAGIDAAIGRVDVVMAPLSANRPECLPALKRAHAAGVGTLAIKVLDSGHADSIEDSLRWVLSQPCIDAIILGTLKPAHLLQAVAIARECRPDA